MTRTAKPPQHSVPPDDPVTCSRCGATAHLHRNDVTGNTLALDAPGDLRRIHPCVLGATVAVLTVRSGIASVAPLKDGDGSGAFIANVLRPDARTGPAEWAATATRRLKGYSVVVLTRGEVPPDLYGGAEGGGE